VALALVAGGAYVACRVLAQMTEMAYATNSEDRVAGLLGYYIAAGCGKTRPWPAERGKAFILWLVATNQLNRHDPRSLRTLFSPGHGSSSLEAAGGVRAYAHLTQESLRDGTVDLAALTSFLGRRAGAWDASVAVHHDGGVALIADLTFADVAIIGYSNGQARILDRAALGLGPSDPLVAGEDSKSPLLREFAND